MNAQSKPVDTETPPAAGAAAVDDRNPWLGLASFTEETRQFFYGREDEVAELARRVQRKLLTVLFGQSGLGKTSILRAGLVPRLRGQGYCPVYVRIDYAREAPEPAEQIKQAIAQSARRSGEWTQVGVAVAGESLWEFLHHRDDVLLDESGATLIPLLIFDQFEEIFTLAQSDDFGRARAARFIADLADLVENRPPQDIERRLEEDDSAAERFDFARGDYRVLIALREDYLAPLEGLKHLMPSVTQNRLRLAPMTGTQALAAVIRPGKHLVTQDVAAAIVRFVAGGAEIANAEVEPSLLSLICRELNDTRLAQGRGEISLDLLEGSHASILSNFYQRCLADQPAAVRRIIEDELLTASGFRENVAEEKLLGSFAAAAASANTLPLLVNRRLLRIEERLDVRRVELTHDVLCGVVKSSRQLRQEREARDASERQLAEQRERARATRQALLRARKIAVFCSVLAAAAVLAAAFAYISTQRAKRAERVADDSRRSAEQLLGYLTDDFSRELEDFGRLDLVAELGKRQVDYFEALPEALKGPDSVRNGAMAMVHYAAASRRMGHFQVAEKYSTQAVRLLAALRAAGDHSAGTTIDLALAQDTQSSTLFDLTRPDSLALAQNSAELLKPLAESPHASLAARRAYLEVLNNLGYQQLRFDKNEDAANTLYLGLRVAEQAGARELKIPDVSAQYAYLGGWLLEALSKLDRHEEARRVAMLTGAVADRLIEQRPGDLLALKSAQLIRANVSFIDNSDMHEAEAIESATGATAASRSSLRFDPGNEVAIFNLAVDFMAKSNAEWAIGRPNDAVNSLREALQAFSGHLHGPRTVNFFLYQSALTVQRMADVGDIAATVPVIAEAERQAASIRPAAADDPQPALAHCWALDGRVSVALRSGSAALARDLARQCLRSLSLLKASNEEQQHNLNSTLFAEDWQAAQAEYLLGELAAAEKSLRDALAVAEKIVVFDNGDRRDRAMTRVLLGMSLARQGKSAQAREVIGPVVGFYRTLAAGNVDDQSLRVEEAASLYAQALADPPGRGKLLAEARTLIESVPPAMRGLHSVAIWRDRIDSAIRGET